MKLRHHLIHLVFFLALAVGVTFPLVLNMGGQLIGHHTGDAYEMGHHIWWFKYAIQNGEPLFFQTLLAYPDGIQGISLWSNPLQFFPAWAFAFVMPVAAAYNLQILITMALNGWAMTLLMRGLLRRESGDAPLPALHLPSILAGVIFETFPTFQGHLFGGHAGLMVMWPVPLLTLALYRLIETRRPRDFALAVLFFMLSPTGHTLQVIYVLLPIMGLFWLWTLIRRDWRGLLNVTLVGIVGGVLLILFLIPVVQDTFGSAAYTGDGGYVRFSTDLLGIVTPSFEHVLFGRFDFTHRILGVNIIESFTYVGIVAGGLTLIAALTRKGARYWLALAALTWVLALGPIIKLLDVPLTFRLDDYAAYVTSPAAPLYQLPGLSLARTPGRFTFAFALAVAALAGYGAFTVINHWPRTGRAALIALGVFAVFEYQAFWPYATVPADVPPAVAALAERDDVRAVMDLPWGNLLAAKEGLYLQTWHQKPLIAGQVTRQTPVSPAKLTLLEETLDPALLDDAGADVLILHKRYASDALNARLRERFGAPAYEDERVALFDVPDTQTVPQFVVTGAESIQQLERGDWYFYAPRAGWYTFEAALDSPNSEARPLEAALNNAVIWRGQASSTSQQMNLPLFVADAGYHTLTLRITPPCPQPVVPETLTCPLARVTDAQLTQTSDADAQTPIAFADGITLESWDITREGDALDIRLAWAFDSARRDSDIRFIKVIDAATGQPVAEVDSALKRDYALYAGERRFESFTLALPQDAPAALEVYAGWYALPDVTRYAVLSQVEGAADRWARIAVLE